MYSFIETSISFYRTLLPVPLWINYFLRDWDYSNVLSGVAIMFYLILKFPRTYEKAMLTIITLKAVIKGHLVRTTLHYFFFLIAILTHLHSIEIRGICYSRASAWSWWSVRDLPRDDDGTGDLVLQTHFLWRMCRRLVRCKQLDIFEWVL